MKIFRLVVSALLLLSSPAMAVEYKGYSIDGQKLPARAYYYATGGIYNVQVSFHKQRATIYFNDGNQIDIQLNNQVILDAKNIEGFGKLGQYRVNNFFSVGLIYGSDWPSATDSQLQQSNPLEGLWKISLD
ncbi:hypothetical protein HCG51_11015 [Tolypothrix sp. PCC 7910]|uniref:hypothetical protein n=1 Tax=Tolypothrix sp. PCC 7910 TaxID=2099387 RepID=UPI0014278A23|nr:hypothetical protein [Tolypothrix sp. PCC 7910]QIR37196.1 hypothetical protein HCG51_11015 [Tolypothrix sp. PCC 7910]